MSSFGIGYFLGQIVGNGIFLFVLYALIDTLICKRVFDDPVKGKLTAAAAATAVMLFIAVVGMDRPDFGVGRIVATLVAALLVSIYARQRGMKVRARQADLDSTFD